MPSGNQKSELKATKGHVMTWNRYHRYQGKMDTKKKNNVNTEYFVYE